MADFSVHLMAPGKNDPAFTPYVQVFVSTYSSDSKGRILISPHLMTEGEIDESVNWLIKELEKARKGAKRKLQGAKKRLRERH